MFSRIRNHEKLVENGENPSIVARKLKEGTHEKDSDPFRILGGNGNKGKTVYSEESVEMTENAITDIEGGGDGREEEKGVIGKRKGKDRNEGREGKEGREGGREEENAVTELIMKDPIDAEEDKNALSLSSKKQKRPKNGSLNLEFNLSEVQDLHSYKEPSSSKMYKGKKVLKEVVEEVVHYDGKFLILFYHLFFTLQFFFNFAHH
jgi:hypothetical protein